MAADEIRVCSWYLESLRTSLATARRKLDAGASVPGVDLSEAPEVEQAFIWMADKWDEHRNEFTTNLLGMVDALDSIIESFEQADTALANPQ